MANYGDNDAELDGDRKETGDSFRRHAHARLSSASQLWRADLSRPDDRSLRVIIIIINENSLDESIFFLTTAWEKLRFLSSGRLYLVATRIFTCTVARSEPVGRLSARRAKWEDYILRFENARYLPAIPSGVAPKGMARKSSSESTRL